MDRLKRTLVLIALLATALMSGCAQQQTYDYTAFNQSKPTSILVIPPKNDTVEVNAPYIFLSTISAPLADKGYYVFPVAVIDQMLKENGLSSPAEMHEIPLEKLNEHIAPDAVLYVNITDWGQKYKVVTSTTVVKATMELIDAKTGERIWHGTASAQRSSGDGGGLAGMIINAVVDQVVGNIVDYTPELSTYANQLVINNRSTGLPSGHYITAEQ